MLHKETVDPSTLELLIQMQQKEYLNGFFLVGGTPLVDEPVTMENISMLSVEDIIAMKLNAISVSGQRVKDFIDIYYLLDHYSVEKMIGFYKKKYTHYNEINVLKSLCWFEDVDLSDWPVLLLHPKLQWATVKKKIQGSISQYLKQL